jgi:hypothetical protein
MLWHPIRAFWAMNTSNRREIRDELIDHFREIEHPVDPHNPSRILTLTNIEDAVDALLALLHLRTGVADDDVQELERQVLFSLRDYRSATGGETERRMRAAGHLAERLEPFQRKLFTMRYPDREVPSLRRMLQIVGGCEEKPLRDATEEEILTSLREQSTEEAILHDAYYFRNAWAHEARKLNPREELRYWRSVVAAFLLISGRNIDLVPTIMDRVARTARSYVGLGICLEHMRKKFDDAKWRNQYYIDLTVGVGGLLEEHVEEFLESRTERLLVVAGRTGAGKSTFLERLVTELADQALHALDLEGTDHLLIPVHLELKRYVSRRGRTLPKKLHGELDRNNELGLNARQRHSWPFALSPIGFVVCLDGLDEVKRSEYQAVVSEIDDLMCDFENVKVIVAGRPHAVPAHWCQAMVRITPLSSEEVITYFEHPERLNLLAPHVRVFLEDRPDLVDILQDPLMTEAACCYWSQFDPPDSNRELDPITEQEALLEGPLLEHLYRCFFDHHLSRVWAPSGKESTRSRLVNALATLASEMDGDPFTNFDLISAIFTRFELGDADLGDFLDTGLLRLVEGDYCFRNNTVKAYFAARRLRSLTRQKRDTPQALSLIREANQFWHYCVRLLKEIAPLEDCSPFEDHLTSLAQSS